MLICNRGAAIVYLERIKNNIKVIKKMASKSMIMPIVKANGYGHGIFEVANACIKGGADFLGVATADEAFLLYESGIRFPILVMGATFESEFEKIINYNITATIFTWQMAERLSNYARKIKKEASIHIKIDTGMNRIGFVYNNPDIFEIIKKIYKLDYLNVTGIFSHFATSDSNADFTLKQFQRFCDTTEKLKSIGLHIPLMHISNSGAILNYPKYNLDIVRPGVLTYGLAPCSSVDGKKNIQSLGIMPALEFKSQIINIKKIKKGESVGYSRNYIAKKDTLVATIPLGYADGIHRILSNNGKININGKMAPIIGNICMDQFMVDVSEIDTSIGSEISIIDYQLSAEEISNYAKTINYEILTSISSRIKRIYL